MEYGLAVQLVGGCYDSSVRGLRLIRGLRLTCYGSFPFLCEEKIQTPSQVGIWIQASWYDLRPVGKM